MPDVLLEDVTAEVERLAQEHLYSDSPEHHSSSIQTARQIDQLLDHGAYPKQRDQLHYLASIMSSLIADTDLSFGQMKSAWAHTHNAWRHADMIGHNSLRLAARETQAWLAYCADQPERALELAYSAEEWATEPIGAAGFHASIALFSAMSSRNEDAQSALTLSFAAHESATGTSQLFDRVGGTFSYPLAKMYYAATLISMEMGDSKQAETYATQALTEYANSPAELRPYGNILSTRIDLAHARLLNGQAEGASSALAAVLNAPTEHRLDWVVLRLKKLRQTFQQHSVSSSTHGRQLMSAIEDFCANTAASYYSSANE